MARRGRSRGRDVQGILLLDKPKGLSSNKALQEVKSLFFAKKAGHTGSLDPLATGLLPICFGHATRISGFLLDADKRYEVVCRLGITTTTADAEGDVLRTRAVGKLNPRQVAKLLNDQFSGVISQLPPMHSALKYKGKRLYELARKGVEVEREPRQVNIFDIQLVALEGELLEISVHCSKGTYVRTLAEDIGEALGVGAHAQQLRRTAVGPFTNAKMFTLDELRHIKQTDVKSLDGLLLPAETALQHFPEIHLDANSAFYLRNGQAVQAPKAPTSGWVRLYIGANEFMGMGMVQDDGKIAPKRLFS